MAFRLDGRVALITGASSGFGAHFARLYAEAGAKVVLGARRVERVEALAAEIGADALAVALDVGDEASTIAAYDAAEARFGTVDTIVANAGMSHGGRATDVSAEGLRQLLDANFLGAYLTVREGAKRLIAAGARESGKGRAIIVGSITAHLTGHGDSAYAASKAGVAHLGRNLAREWVRQGINVNVIQPGYVQTEIAGDWFETEGGAKQIAGFHRKRMMGITALDPMMLYFASDASAQVTGAVIDVDDGQSL
ncbi:MAG: SDR family NAD(P)-dependent oxidoreductase [Candidatus Sphingomonas colombiensis]|nr:SDR family NAD(P)-dependent oxidoreductase [Sphingomonas sp.]WEK43707.1 MAG: SDR family NAD(P)-dependent oxidoreductase [Sphingomonas sp.]